MDCDVILPRDGDLAETSYAGTFSAHSHAAHERAQNSEYVKGPWRAHVREQPGGGVLGSTGRIL